MGKLFTLFVDRMLAGQTIGAAETLSCAEMIQGPTLRLADYGGRPMTDLKSICLPTGRTMAA